jgi:hypothetical protein
MQHNHYADERRRIAETLYSCPMVKGRNINKETCQAVCGRPEGNVQCFELKCRSKWLFCPVCIEQIPILSALKILDSVVLIDRGYSTCYLHHATSPLSSHLTTLSAREKLIKIFPKLFVDIPPPPPAIPRENKGFRKHHKKMLKDVGGQTKEDAEINAIINELKIELPEIESEAEIEAVTLL